MSGEKEEKKYEDEEKPSEEEDEEEEQAKQDVVLTVAEKRFALTLARQKSADNLSDLRSETMALITENNMVGEYSRMCDAGLLIMDESLLTEMEQKRDEKAKELSEAGEAARTQEGEVEVSDNELAVARHLALTAGLSEAIEAYENVSKLTSGKSIDRYLAILRLCLAYNDDRRYIKYSEIVEKLIDKAGDWDKRNRFRIYNGIHNFRVRKFSESAECLLSGIATFTATEMFDYKRLVAYTIVASVVSLARSDLKKRVIDSADIRQVILDADMADLKELTQSLYECRYRELMASLVRVMGSIRGDLHLSTHANYYLRQMRIRTYSQYLRSYLSVQLSSMSAEFGLSEAFLDSELSSLIANGQLVCKMDKVRGVVELKRRGSKGTQYSEIIRKGDLLLGRLQRLSRVITY